MVARLNMWRSAVVAQAAFLALAGTLSAVLAVVGTGGGCPSVPRGEPPPICGHSPQPWPWGLLAPCLIVVAVAEVLAAFRRHGPTEIPIRHLQLPIAVAVVVLETVWTVTRFRPILALIGVCALFISAIVATGPPSTTSKREPAS
jgi:hypothetical protein